MLCDWRHLAEARPAPRRPDRWSPRRAGCDPPDPRLSPLEYQHFTSRRAPRGQLISIFRLLLSRLHRHEAHRQPAHRLARASASTASLLLRLTFGSTSWGTINLTECSSIAAARAGMNGFIGSEATDDDGRGALWVKRHNAQRVAILAVNGSAAIKFSLPRASMSRTITLSRPGVPEKSDGMPIGKRGM